MKKHFAFVNMPASGHINPTLPLVTELLRRGHRVSYAVGRESLEPVRATGAEVVELATELPVMPPRRKLGPEQMGQMMQLMVGDIKASYPVLRQRFHADAPDAVCFDAMTPLGRMLAEEFGVPAIALVPNFAANENFSLHQVLADGDDEEPFPAEMFAEFGRRMQEAADEFGLRAQPPFGAPPAELNLVFLPREFQLGADTFDERFHFLGPLLGERAEQPWQPRDADAPLLFVSLGTAFNNRPEFYQMCFEAFGGSHWQVAMAIGQHVQPADLGPVPANFDVQASFPQPAVLRHAAVFLSHTGMGSTMESLQAGVPLVAVPQMPEQAANAGRAEELGLGRRLDPDTVTATELREAVDAIAADEQVRANLDRMREVIGNCGGAAAGADALEAHLS